MRGVSQQDVPDLPSLLAVLGASERVRERSPDPGIRIVGEARSDVAGLSVVDPQDRSKRSQSPALGCKEADVVPEAITQLLEGLGRPVVR